MRWFHRGGFYAQCCGSLMDPEGRAIDGHSLETGSLGSHSVTRVSIGESQDIRSNLFILSAVSCTMTDTASVVKHWMFHTSRTYLESSVCHPSLPCRLLSSVA